MSNTPTNAPVSRRAFLAVGAGTAAALAGCGGGSGPGGSGGGGGGGSVAAPTGSFDPKQKLGSDVTLSYWNGFTGGDGPFMKKLVDQFNKEFPQIKVAPNTVQWADFYQRVPAAVNAGKGPDVGVMHIEQLSTNAARKVIVPVDDVVKSLGLSEADFSPDVWKATEYKGNRYGIPLDVHSLAMYYNKDHFKKAGIATPPKDAASFGEAMDKLKSSGIANPFWVPTRWPAHLMFLSLLWQYGGEPYQADGSKATFDSEAGVKALRWMREQVTKGYSPENVAVDSQYVGFKNKKLSATWDGIWQINDLTASKLPFGVAAVPQIGSEPGVWASSHNFFVTKQATGDKLTAAKIFIDWMSKQSLQWAGAGMVPARKSVRENPKLKQLPQGPVAAGIEAMHFLPPVAGLGDIQAQTLELAVADAVAGRKQPDAALKDAAGKATTLMAANLKKFGA